jgi:heavy metal sensor kinase
VKPLGLRSKLTLRYSAIFTLLLAVTFIASFYLFKTQLEADLNSDLSDRMQALRGYIRFEHETPVLNFDEGDPEAALFVRTSTRYFQVASLQTGAIVIQSPEMQLLGLSFVPEELQTIDRKSGPTDLATDEGELRFLDERIVSPSGQKYIVQVGTSLEQVSLALRRFSELAIFLIPCSIVLAAGAGWFLAGGVLAPMRSIARAAQQIEPSNLAGRLPLTGAHDELDQLAAAFNELLSRIENVVGELRQLSGSIAHELRTPLAALRGEAEIALLHAHSIEETKDVLSSQLEDFDRLARMIDQLLTLARAESGGIRFNLQAFDLGITIREVADTFSLVATAREITLDSVTEPNLLAIVDPQWIENVLINLLDNAIKYTPPGGHVYIDGRLDADTVRIEIRDTGQGIAAEALPHIFDRFYRADPSRTKQVTGVGLGLSFVKWIIEGHAGTIEVSSRLNSGSTFTFRLPRASGPLMS